VVRYFSQETNLPLTLGLLIDTSGSQRRVLGLEKDASYQFLDQVLREDKDQAFVIHFDREVELLQDLTSSRKKLEATLGSLDTPGFWPPRGQRPGGGGYPGGGYPGGGRPGGYPGRRRGGTSLYDAVFLASDELMKRQSGRKAVIALTDGVDNGSRLTLTQAIESAQRADTLVYAVLFADPGAYGGFGGPHAGGRRRSYPAQRTDGKKILERMSKETGGGFFEVSQKQPINAVFSRIEEELRNQYSIGYSSDGTGDAYRKIHLTAKQKGLVVQARDGYYPQQPTR
jgi:VWFA-related protein